MKPKTMFLKMYNKLPKEARIELMYGCPNTPMTLNVVALEVKNNTELGRNILKKLGYIGKGK